MRRMRDWAVPCTSIHAPSALHLWPVKKGQSRCDAVHHARRQAVGHERVLRRRQLRGQGVRGLLPQHGQQHLRGARQGCARLGGWLVEWAGGRHQTRVRNQSRSCLLPTGCLYGRSRRRGACAHCDPGGSPTACCQPQPNAAGSPAAGGPTAQRLRPPRARSRPRSRRRPAHCSGRGRRGSRAQRRPARTRRPVARRGCGGTPAAPAWRRAALPDD
jgi:hypothetical protein